MDGEANKEDDVDDVRMVNFKLFMVCLGNDDEVGDKVVEFKLVMVCSGDGAGRCYKFFSRAMLFNLARGRFLTSRTFSLGSLFIHLLGGCFSLMGVMMASLVSRFPLLLFGLASLLVGGCFVVWVEGFFIELFPFTS